MPSPAATWRWPPLGITSAVFVVVLLVKMLFPMFSDPDFYWHLKTGEWLLSTHSLSAGEPFTYTHAGAPLLHNEWLFQVLLALVFQAGGFIGVSLAVTAIHTASWYLTFLSCRTALASDAKALVVTLFFCGTFGTVAPRPHLFTFLFFAWLAYLIVRFKYRGSTRHLWTLPVVMVPWANIHGGFFLGIVLMVAFAGAEWLMWFWRGGTDAEAKARLWKLSLCIAAAFVATLINPHFLTLWWYPFHAIVKSGDTSAISEWQSPNFHMLGFQYFLITVAIFWLGAVLARKKPDLTELLVPSIFIGGALYSARNIPLAALTMAPFFSVFLTSVALTNDEKSPLADRSSNTPPAWKARLSALLAAGNRDVGEAASWPNWVLVGFSAIVLLAIYPIHAKTLDQAIAQTLPVNATDFLIANRITGRMFNTYHTGGYLLYRLPPGQKVFTYPRTDFYRPEFLKENLAIYSGDPSWKKLFDKYDIEFVVCESAAPLRQLLREGGEFKLVYDDGLHSVLLRDIERFRPLIAKFHREPHD